MSWTIEAAKRKLFIHVNIMEIYRDQRGFLAGFSINTIKGTYDFKSNKLATIAANKEGQLGICAVWIDLSIVFQYSRINESISTSRKSHIILGLGMSHVLLLFV